MSEGIVSTLGEVGDEPDAPQPKNLALQATIDSKGYVSLERAIGGGGAIHTSLAHLRKLIELADAQP